LVLSGLLCRRVSQAERGAAELIGPGDLIRPWDVVSEWSTLPVPASWAALLPTRIAVLDAGFSRRAGHFPAISEELVHRALLRSRYLAILSTIASQRRLETRLHMLFWHLADRFGRMRGEWVQIPVPLTHCLLAELVGARRPSVSTVVSRLQSRGLLIQEPGGWRISGTVPPEYAALHESAPTTSGETVAA
jgi:CRP-like cAMP-binding protein